MSLTAASGRMSTEGFYLFEVLISLLVMSIGMLGIAAMLMVAHKASSSSYLRSQALRLAYSIVESMRANRTAAVNGNYTISNLVTSGTPAVPSQPSPNCSQSVCTTQQLAAWDSWYWLNNISTSLPAGGGSIATTLSGTNTIATVIIQWNDNPSQNLLGAGGQTYSGNTNLASFTLVTSL